MPISLPYQKLTNTGANDANKINANFTAIQQSITDNWVYVSNYTDLIQAVEDIGSDYATIVIDVDTTIWKNYSIPLNVSVFWVSNKKISHSTFTLTFDGKFVNEPRWQILDGTGTITFASGIIKANRPEWQGETASSLPKTVASEPSTSYESVAINHILNLKKQVISTDMQIPTNHSAITGSLEVGTGVTLDVQGELIIL